MKVFNMQDEADRVARHDAPGIAPGDDHPWRSDRGDGTVAARAALWWLLAAAAVPWIVAAVLVLGPMR